MCSRRACFDAVILNHARFSAAAAGLRRGVRARHSRPATRQPALCRARWAASAVAPLVNTSSISSTRAVSTLAGCCGSSARKLSHWFRQRCCRPNRCWIGLLLQGLGQQLRHRIRLGAPSRHGHQPEFAGFSAGGQRCQRLPQG